MNKNVSMEPLNQGHANDLFDLTEANRNYLREWLPWLDSVRAVADTEAFIRSMEEQARSGGGPNYAIFCDGSLCGVAGFHKIDTRNRIGSMGYWLAEPYVGNGIISEAVKNLIKIGFAEFELNKIEISCAEGNIKSRAIAERLGFTQEATLREREWLYTRFVDHVVYSMLASEHSRRFGGLRAKPGPFDHFELSALSSKQK